MKTKNTGKLSRRNFLKQSSVVTFGLASISTFLSGCIDMSEEQVGACFSDELHYFDDNLTNIHLYFFNAKITGRYLKRNACGPAYMVVKLPQQHISERLIREAVFKKNYSNSTKNTDSKISGFSFLAFKLFPKSEDENEYITVDSRASNLFDWNNQSYFDLVIPAQLKYKQFNGTTKEHFKTFKDGNLRGITESKAKVCDFYKTLCTELFTDAFPITIFEIPEGLFVTPYAQESTAEKPVKAVFASSDVKRKRFLYNNGEVTRSVEVVWNSQMWFQQFENTEPAKPFGEKRNPSLRPAGYLIDPALPQDNKIQCPKEDRSFLPTFLDKQELTYIASLGRINGNNQGKEWNIETKGLTFTGLGTVAKFHYKNFAPPEGTDLAEYEHHITMGRDEFIKVSRIGVISCTGQRALHVSIGRRKIRDGVSYMEFKEYIEIIQKEIKYFDEKYFIFKDPNKKEPFNYIQARTHPPTDNDSTVIHSFDDIYDGQTNTDDRNDVWWDRVLWGLKEPSSTVNYLPGNWNAHYRRWPFKSVVADDLVSKPIDRTLSIEEHEVVAPPTASCDCVEAFWPILEETVGGKHPNCEMSFTGTDWNNNAIKFTTTFLFIRKTFIECATKESVTKLYTNFIGQKDATRRHIRFVNSQIALAADFTPQTTPASGKEELPNKSNIAKTDFIEYYFSLCTETVKKTLSIAQTGKIIEGSEVLFSSVFNERFFPLYPQVKRAQLYIENVQGYAREPLPSIINYNEDYIIYGFEGLSEFVNAKGQTVKGVYNKGRLIFNHTDKFLQGKDNTLIEENGKVIEKVVADGYAKVKQAFSGAGDLIGGLVNPDFDLQSIGLVKQSISIGKSINEKYEKLENFAGKLEKFNPSDLLRQAPEIFNGISLIDILKEVFPEFEAPINEINKIAAQAQQLSAAVIDNPIYQNLRVELRRVNGLIKEYIKKIEDFQRQMDGFQNQIKDLKDKLNFENQFADIQNLIENKIAQMKAAILSYESDLVLIAESNLDKISEFLVTELMAKAETLYPYFELLKEGKAVLDVLQNEPNLSAPVKALIAAYIAKYFAPTKYLLIDLGATVKGDILRTYALVKADVTVQMTAHKKVYDEFVDTKRKELQARKDYLERQADQALLATFQAAATVFKAKSDALENLKKELVIDDLLTSIREVRGLTNAEKEIIARYETELTRVQGVVGKAFDLASSANLLRFIEAYSNAVKNFDSIKSKLRMTETEIEGILNKTISGSVLAKQIINSRDILQNHYQTKYDLLKKDIDFLSRDSNDILNAYKYVTGPFIWEGLATNIPNLPDETKKELENIKAILKIPQGQQIVDEVLTASQININQIKNIRNQINQAVQSRFGIENQLKIQVQEYENLLKQYVSQQANSLVNQVLVEIRRIEQQLVAAVDPVEIERLSEYVAQARNLYSLLTSISRQEVNYKWQTSSFKDADFGIVSFVASSDPKTTLTVNVKSVIHFQADQFPPAVSKVEVLAENRLRNFGISLMKSMLISFNEVSFIAGTDQKPKFDVKIRGVEFSGAFAFVQAFESWLQSLMGDAFRLRLLFDSVNIGYTLPIPDIKTPSFSFFNLTLNFDFWLYFDKRPMELGFSLARQDSKFGIAVGIYAGFGFFGIRAEPKNGLTVIEIGLEFGGYFGLSLGPLRGDVKLVVGLYYKKDKTTVVIEGYFLCEGRVKLWFITITARFYMGVRSQGGYVEGRCTVTYEVSLGAFFKRSFSATFYKKLAGASPGNTESGSRLASTKALNAANASLPAKSAMKSKIIAMKQNQLWEQVENPLKRVTEPLSQEEWEIFINSYE
jgi:hypothetical protein